MARLDLRRLDRTAWLRGAIELQVALEAIAAVRPHTVLDAGCGTAEFAAPISAPRLICIDSSAAAVESARSRGLEAQQADIEELPFADGYFDVVTCNWVLYHRPERDRGITELARVLRSGGRFVGMYNFPDHLQEVWHVTGAAWDADGFDAESGLARLDRHFAKVDRIETNSQVMWESREALQTYLDAFREMVGPLTAPPGPYPFHASRHNCVFVADKA